TTRGGEDYTFDLDIRSAGDALQNGAVLAVHRNDLTAATGAGLGDERPPHDERFLVRQRDALPALERRKRRVQSRRADDRVQHDVDVLAPGCLDQTFGPHMPVVMRTGAVSDHAHKAG